MVPEINYDGSTLAGHIESVEPNTERDIYSPPKQDLPYNVKKTGSVFLRERTWWNRQYAPSFP